MAKIQITLVGGQTTPVYQGIIHTNPDRVILVNSTLSENEADRIHAEMKVDCTMLRFDPVDLTMIKEAVLKLKSSLSSEDQISINVSSGTKTWALLFYEFFNTLPNTTLFVVDQNNLVWTFKTYSKSEVAFDMDVQFRLLGNPLKNYIKIDDYTELDAAAIKEIRQLRKFNYRDFNSMTEYLFRFPNEKVATGSSGSTINWDPSSKSFAVSMFDKKGNQLSKTLYSEHIRNLLLNTGWFEYETALLLSKWTKTKQLRMNCVFPTNNGSPKNEIDIIINTGSKLLFVECKTQIKNETDIDKFAAAVKIYGGLGSKALFVTDTPMTEKAIEKCNDHSIMFFCVQSNLMEEQVSGLLFQLLESVLFKLNTK